MMPTGRLGTQARQRQRLCLGAMFIPLEPCKGGVSMKNKISILSLITLLLCSGCAMMGITISAPIITPMPNNAFEISMRGGVMTQRESLQSEWIKVAGKQCADYEVVSRDFATQYDMPTLSGIIKCNK
jgi:hypothetical protein